MCGIFALLNNINSENKNVLEVDYVENEFMKAKGRGPENSVFDKYDNNVLLGFHRLAINGINSVSNQPIVKDNVIVICNGEIYNYKDLYKQINITPNTDSDCEIIIHLYEKYGIHQTMQMLDGVFAFVLIDYNVNKLFVSRDPYGVRPLYIMQNTNMDSSKEQIFSPNKFKLEQIAFSSELKQLSNITQTLNKYYCHNNNNFTIKQYKPSHYTVYEYSSGTWNEEEEICYSTPGFWKNNEWSLDGIKKEFLNAVKKRVEATDRPIACLLSGGLDSSLVTSIVKKYYDGQLETYSIGLEGSEDLKYARIVADYLGTEHHEVIVSEKDFFDAIPKVIETIESYDTTTVRASVGNYLIAKYISENSEAKVIFNGDGSDELSGGYLYFHKSPDSIEFDSECRRLLKDIAYYDVLRSDRSISSNGLEPRTPFLDRGWVQYYLSIPNEERYNALSNCEKYLIRKAFDDDTYLPKEILWRTKEAFSDGVSSLKKSWYEIIEERISDLFENDNELMQRVHKMDYYDHNIPKTLEQKYYRYLFEKNYENHAKTIPYFWMPKYVNAKDASARTLDVYK